MAEEYRGPAQDDLAWCYDTVEDISRTFALTIAELEAPMSGEICTGYLLCRIADTIEDATHVAPADQSRLLRTYSQALDPGDETTIEAFRTAVDPYIPADHDDDWGVVADAQRVVATFRDLPAASRAVIRPSVRELTDGMATFVDRYAAAGGLRIQTIEELEEYCWYVAGTIGSFVTELLIEDVPPDQRDAFEDNATAFSRLLQLVNVTRDIASDYREEDNVYVPAALLAEHGLTADDIADIENAEAFVPVVSALADRAERYLDDTQAWIEAMPETRGNSLAAWAIPFLLAVGTLRELKTRPAAVLKGDVKVSRAEVYALLEQFADDSDPSLTALRREMRAGSLKT
ncbi:MAG: phytoene/squalene synthase family protein [Halorhabdus sp.]